MKMNLSAGRIWRGITNAYRREILRDKPLLAAKRWFADKGDSAHRLNYDLGPESVVVDLGGYIGDFAYEIHSRYESKVHIFEPVPRFYQLCVERFSESPKVVSHCYGLGSKTGSLAISDLADASSLFMTGKEKHHTMVEVRPIVETLNDLGISKIDLLKINIEGGEYDVLQSLISSGWLPRINNLQVQFHTVGSSYEADRNFIRNELAKTHKETWCYYFVWENWECLQENESRKS